MKGLSLRAKLYIITIQLIGAGLTFWQLPQLSWQQPILLLLIAVLSAIAKILKVEGATNRSSYNIGVTLFGFALLTLGLPETLCVMLFTYLVEWYWHKYKWYIQLFNIGAITISICAGYGAHWALSQLGRDYQFAEVLSILALIAGFTLINHFLVGLVLWLARQENFSQSGIFDRLPLSIDATHMGMGAGAALLWQINPYASILAVIPIYLLYTTLKIPALQRQAATDAKTGLFNARYFSQALEKELSRADRFDRPLTIVIADLDLLRNINNTYGHLAGDAVLIHVARILQQALRDYDIVARFGGEEFAFLLPETTPEKAYPRIEAIRTQIAKTEFQIPTQPTPIKATMSFGIAGRIKHGQTAKDLIHHADLAVYQAKFNGRNRICIYDNQQGIPQELQHIADVSRPVLDILSSAETPTHQTQPEREPPPPTPEPPVSAGVSRLSSHHLLNLYLILVSVSALGVSIWSYRPLDPLSGLGLALFAILIICAEWLALDIYHKDTAVSTSGAPLLAGMLLFHSPAVWSLSLVLAITAWIKHRSPLSRFLFNWSQNILAGMASMGFVQWVGGDFSNQPQVLQIMLSLCAAVIFYIGNTGLVSIAIYLDTHERLWRIWNERFRWLAVFYLAFGVLAYLLVYSFKLAGVTGVLMILAPMLMLRISQKQYLEHTSEMVNQVRTTNVELSKRASEISQLNEELIVALAQAIDLRDPFVLGHSQHVSRYAILIAKELNLPSERIELIRRAGLLHDLGKLGIPEQMLFKPARLTSEEYEVVKKHAKFGAELLAACQSLKALVPIIRHHHEFYDGNGYPDQLRGETIPLEARILSVADAVEAMASDRPYRRGMNYELILNEIKHHAGKQFDPKVVEAFEQVIKRDGGNIIINSTRPIETADTLLLRTLISNIETYRKPQISAPPLHMS